MGGFVTAGMAGQLVTVGLGGETIVIIEKPEAPRLVGGGPYFKRRVRGLRSDSQHQLHILRSVISESDLPITVLLPITLDKDLRLKILDRLKNWKDESAAIRITLINIHNKNSVTIKEAYINKAEKAVNVLAGRLVNYIDKAVTILERKHKYTKRELVDVEDALDDIEKAEILKLLDELDELDELEKE